MIPGLSYVISAAASLGVGGLIKGLLWLREVKTNHLPHLQAAVEAIPPALEKQTQAIVTEIGHQRNEIHQLRDAIIQKL